MNIELYWAQIECNARGFRFQIHENLLKYGTEICERAIIGKYRVLNINYDSKTETNNLFLIDSLLL